jgi:ubiquinone biosynthesis protein
MGVAGSLGQGLRLWHIQRVLLKYGLDDLLGAVPAAGLARSVFRLAPDRLLSRRTRALPRGERIRRALEELGPIFVKFGQILSTRRDLLPDDIAFELARLQDRVPPFESSVAQAEIEKALGAPVGELFAEFDAQPLASASIAQVHAARLKSGEQVVVKVLRPGIGKTIRHDVELLKLAARLAHRYSTEARRLRPIEVVAEFEKTIFDELDLVREAANATQLRRNFEGSPALYVPEVHWEYTRERVLCLERISGIPVANIDELRDIGVDFKVLAARGVEVFFTQVFRDNFFHADMHPGNIFVSRSHPHDPQYIAVDFGIVGSLTDEDRHYLAGNFLAFFSRDYRRVAQLHVDSGWVPPSTRVEDFEAAIRTVCEPIFEKPLAEISFGHLLLRLFQVARRFDMQVQPQLVLLQKTLLNIEGLGRQLYPQLDLWQTAKPYLEKWMHTQVGPRAVFGKLKNHLPDYGEALPELPLLAHQLLQKAHAGELEIQWRSNELEAVRRELRAGNRRTIRAIGGATLVLSAALIYGLDGYQPPMLLGAPLASWVLGALGALLLLGARPPAE